MGNKLRKIINETPSLKQREANLAVTVLEYIVLGKALEAFYGYEIAVENNMSRIDPINSNPVEEEILGTNYEKLRKLIEISLSRLGIQYVIRNNYTILNETIYDSEDNIKVTETVRWMFLLTSPELEQPSLTSRISQYRDVLLNAEKNMSDKPLFPFSYVDDPQELNIENTQYSTEFIHEDQEKTPAMAAAKNVLEVIALTVDDEWFDECREFYGQFKTASKETTPQKSSKLWFWVIAVVVIGGFYLAV